MSKTIISSNERRRAEIAPLGAEWLHDCDQIDLAFFDEPLTRLAAIMDPVLDCDLLRVKSAQRNGRRHSLHGRSS